MSDIVLTDSNFEEEVLKSKVPVLVDFWAPWCGPCKAMSPVIDEFAKEIGDKAKVGKMNVDENTQTPGKYSIMSIPTLIVFKNGEPVKSMVGVQSKEALKKALE